MVHIPVTRRKELRDARIRSRTSPIVVNRIGGHSLAHWSNTSPELLAVIMAILTRDGR